MKLHNLTSNQKGISFIEILILLLLVSLFATFVIPTFMTKQQNMVKKQFVAQFISLMQDTLYQAITTQKVHQIYFDINGQTIVNKVQDLSIDTENQHKKFKILNKNDPSAYVQIPQNIIIKNFFIQNNEDELSTGKKNDIWFYIMPDGTSQSILINFEYNDPESQDIDQFALSINPFYSQVHEYGTFQKP